MKRQGIALGIAMALLAGCERSDARDERGAASGVTYHKDVKPLLDERCTGCHATGEIAFPLTDYQTVAEKKSAVVSAVEARRMPVWLAASGHQSYREDPTFSPEQIELLKQWEAGGFEEGDPADARGDAKGANLVDLDADVTLPLLAKDKSYTPDQKSADDYRCFVVDWPHKDKTKYMTGFQALPGNPEVVHHLVAYMVSPSAVAMVKELDQEEAGDGYQCFGGAMPDRLGDPEVYKRMQKKYPEATKSFRGNSHWLGHWAPGMRGNLLPEGTGLPIAPGGLMVVQVHYYTLTAPNTADRGSEVRFKLADKVDKPGFIIPLTKDEWMDGPGELGALAIPVGGEVTVNHAMRLDYITEYGKEVTGVKDVARLELHSANLHMHSYGKSSVAYLNDDKAGKKEVLLEIPKWNLSWQRDFTLVEPKVVEAAALGDHSLEVSCTFENKTTKEVYGGLGSDDEMCFNFSFFAIVPK